MPTSNVSSLNQPEEFLNPSKSKSSHRGFKWLFVGIIFLVCVAFLDLESILATLSNISPWWLGGILMLMTADRILMVWKWSGLLRALKIRIPFNTLVGYYYQGNLASVFLPTGLGGDLLRAHLVSRRHGATPQVYASLLMEKMVGFLSAFCWAVLGTCVIVFFQVQEKGNIWVGSILVGFLLVFIIFIWSLHPKTLSMFRGMVTAGPQWRVLDLFQRLLEAYSRFGQCRRALATNGVLTISEHGLQLLVYLVLARSLGIEVEAFIFLAVTSLFFLIYRMPIALDGWGVGEVAAIGLYSLIGISAEEAFAIAFLGHILQTLVVLPGLWFLWRSQPIFKGV